jgi:tetratricopeptide (TPR) repeat protein
MLQNWKSRILAPVVLGLSALGAIAQDGTPRDTEEFSRALSHSGYTDFAKELVENALKGTLSDGDRQSLEFTLAEIGVDEARRLPDIKARVTALRAGADKFLEYLKKNPDSPRSNEVRITAVDLLRLGAEFLIASIKSEKDKTKADEFRKECKDCFNKALSIIEPRVSDLQGVEEPTEKDTRELMALRFTQGKMNYLYSGMFEDKKGDEATRRRDEAKKILEDFQIDYSGEVLSFQATKILAQMCIDEDKRDEALDHMNEACASLSEAFTENPALGDDEVIRDLCAEMFLERTSILLLKNNTAEAIANVEKAEKIMPSLPRSQDGRELLLRIAEVHANEGRNGVAVAIVDRILLNDQVTSVAVRATELREKLQTGGSGPEGLLKALENAVAQRDPARAEKIATRILARTRIDEKPEECAEALFLMGSLAFDIGRPYDALAYFQAIAEDYPRSKRGSAAKANEATCYGRLYAIEKVTSWRNKVREAFEDLQKNYKDSVEAKESAYLNGLMMEQENKILEAVESFKKVDASSSKFADAQYRAARNLNDLAAAAAARDKDAEAKKYFTEAESAFGNARRAFIRAAGETLNDVDAKKARDAAFNCGAYLIGVSLQTQTKNIEKAMATIDELTKDATTLKDEKERKERESTILNLRIRVGAAGGGADTVVNDLEEQLKKTPVPTPALAEAALGVAAALDRQATEESKTKGVTHADVQARWRRAINLYASAAKAMKAGALRTDASKVGGRMLVVAAILMNMKQELPFLEIDPAGKITERDAIERARDALDLVEDTDPQNPNSALRYNLAKCHALLGNWEAAVLALRPVVSAYPLFSKDGKFDSAMSKKIPDLAAIVQDYSVARLRYGAAKKVADQFPAALDDLSKLANNADRNGQLYWECRYLYLLGLQLSGANDRFKSELELLERRAPEFDNDKFGIKKRMIELKQIAERIISR